MEVIERGLFVMEGKKGISAVVATVLIILITIAAVTIIWAAIIPMVNDQLDQATLCYGATTALTIKSSGYTCIVNDTTISVQVERDSGDLDLADIQVLISAKGSEDSYSLIGQGYESDDLPDANEKKTFQVIVDDTADVESVAIAPILTNGNSEIACDVSTSVPLNECSS